MFVSVGLDVDLIIPCHLLSGILHAILYGLFGRNPFNFFRSRIHLLIAAMV